MDWRALFLGSGSDIWTVIEKAVLIASEDYPDELRIRRDSITEQLYCASTSDFRHMHLRNVGLDASVENTMRVENPMAPSIPELEVRFRDEQAGGGSSDERGMAFGKDVDDEDGRCTIGRGEEDDAEERDEAEMLADEIEKEEKLTDQVWALRERLKSIDLVGNRVTMSSLFLCAKCHAQVQVEHFPGFFTGPALQWTVFSLLHTTSYTGLSKGTSCMRHHMQSGAETDRSPEGVKTCPGGSVLNTATRLCC